MSELDATLPCTQPGCSATVVVEDFEALAEDSVWRQMIREAAKCDEHNDDGAEEVRQKKRLRYAEAISASLIPSELRGLRWEDYDTEESEDVKEGEKVIATAAEASSMRVEALAAARKWAAGEIRGLVLAGRVGVGKTRLAGIAAQALIYRRIAGLEGTELDRSRIPVRWVMVPELIHKSKGEFGSDRKRDSEKIMSSGGALVLDDIDKVKPTEAAMDLLFEAIEGRKARGASLLVTTNMRYPELRDHLGDPVASRIAGYCEGIRIVGDDRRIAF